MRKPDFQRFLTAVRGGTPDRVPAEEVHVDTEIKERFLDRPIAGLRDDVDFWASAGYDSILLSNKGQPVPDQISHEPLAHRGQASTHEHQWATSGHGAVTNWADFESYPWVTAEEANYSTIDSVRDYLPDGMLAISNHGPLYSGVWRIMGLQSFSYALADEPTLVEAVYEKVGGLLVKMVEENVQKEWVGAIWLGDDIAYRQTLMTSPAVFRQYALPYYGRVGELCREYGKPLLYHLDGNVLPVIEDLIEVAGISALHPIESKAMDIRQVKRDYGNRVALIGNVDVDLLGRGTAEEAAQETRRLLRDVAPGGGYLLGSGNSVPFHVPMENYRAMLDTLFEHGGYPISL